MHGVFLYAAIALMAMVAWGAWQRGWLGWLGRSALTLLAVAASVAGLSLFQLGQKMHWASDGPGILFVMFGFAVCTLLALGLWVATIAAWIGWRRAAARRKAAGSAQAAGTRPGKPGAAAVITVAAVCAIGAGVSWVDAKRDKPAHDSEIAGVAFVGDNSRAYSIDVGGVLKVWTLNSPLPKESQTDSPYGVEATVAVPGARGTRDMWVAAGGRRIALLGPEGVAVIELDSPPRNARPRYVVRDAARAAAAPDGGFVVAGAEGLRWFGPDSARPSAALPWKEAIVALTSGANGVAFADASGNVYLETSAGAEPIALGQVPFAVRALTFSGDSRALVAAGSRSQGMAFDVGSGASRPVQMAFGKWLGPLAGAFVLDCSEAATCVFIDSRSGRSGAAFSGIARRYDRVASSPGAVLVASGNDLVVVTMPRAGYHTGSAYLKDRRF
jgi:hypothetical protein